MGNDLLKYGDCCAPCAEPLVINTPGVQGNPGGDGTNGANGTNAYTVLTGTFTVPAVNATGVASVGDSTWIAPGQILYLQLAGYFQATGKTDNTHVTLKNLGYAGNAAATTITPVLSALAPAGMQGPQSVADITGLLGIKQSVRAATTANITLSGLQTIDGVVLVAGNRVLVKNQTTASQNGIYMVATGAWTRAEDANSSAEVTGGMFCWVEEGTVNADSGWILTTNDPITLDTTALSFAQFSGAGMITAGNGIVITGNTLHAIQSAAYTTGQFVVATGAATLGFATAVTSVALSAPSFLTVGGSPITTGGTLSLTLASQTQNLVFASPNGSSGTPTFRALVAADIPNIAESQVTNLVTDLAAKLSLTGGTMTGALILAGDPVVALGAATKQYVDSAIAADIIAGKGIVVSPADTIHFAQATAYTTGAVPFATSTTAMGFDTTNLLWDNTNKWLGIGTTPSFALHVVGNTTSTSALISAGDFTLTVGNTSSSIWSYFGVHAIAHKNAGAADITGDLRGGWFIAKNSTAQAVTNLYGIVAECQSTGSGTIGSLNTLYAGSPTSSGGATITIAYGLTIAAQKVTGVATGYGLYQAGASDLNFFAGNSQFNALVGIGAAATTNHQLLIQQTLANAAGTVSGCFANMTYTESGASAQVHLAFLTQVIYSSTQNLTADFTAAGSNMNPGLGGLKASVIANNSSATITSLAAVVGQPSARLGTTITHCTAFVGTPVQGDSGSATVTNAYGIYLKDSWGGSLTLTTQYMIYIAACAKGATNWAFFNNSAANLYLGTGKVGIGVNPPTAYLHLPAGATSANNAPLKFTSGSLLTAKEAGAVGYNNDYYHTRNGGTVRFGLGGSIFDHFADAGNTTTTETDLYTDTLAASTFDADGTKIQAVYGGTLVGHATATRQWKVYFGGTVILDTGALSISTNKSWNCRVFLIRASSSEVRYTVLFTVAGLTTEVYTGS